jgi:hypothetical protein
MDELLTGPACAAGRYLVIVEAAADARGGTLDPVAARLEAAGVPLAFAEQAEIHAAPVPPGGLAAPALPGRW